MTTCATCDQPTAGGPLCEDCAAERREHRGAKARMRAELARKRHERTDRR